MRVAVDVLGGDFGADVVVPGATAALSDPAISLTLVVCRGDTPRIKNRISPSLGDRVAFVEADDEVGMHEHAGASARNKPRSSISLALKEVRAGRADAMVSAGHSGAVLAAAIAVLGRIPGIERPALATVLPTLATRTIMVDLGAITDPKPQYLVQFAQMASVYARLVLDAPNPRVALLSNGEEASKGNQLTRETHALLAATPSITFVGNVEGKELLRGNVEVVVTDGFTGNVALKSMEGTVSVLTEVLRSEVTSTLSRKILSLALRPAFRDVRRRLDYAEIGGAPLLGVKGAVIVAHGRSRERAIENAVRVAARTAEQRVAQVIGETMS